MWLGDFNDISSHQEKKGGRTNSQRLIDGFNSMIDDIQMEYMGAKGQNFTWLNNRIGDERVYERLDRVLINSRWRTNYLNAIWINELVIGHDHTPMVILMQREPKRRRMNYHFEEIWMKNPECEDIIKTAWPERNVRHPNLSVQPKLTNWWRQLIRRSKQKFGNNKAELRKPMQRLKGLSQSISCEKTQKEEEDLKNWIKVLWKYEEIY